jgi:hypothetical protein
MSENTTVPRTPTAVDPAVRAAAQNTLNAIVFRDILKPLADGLGPAGDVVVGRVADAIFTRPAT